MLEMRFTTAELAKILDQSTVYVCACPAQVCEELSRLRALFAYQLHCLNHTDTDKLVHERIASATRIAHAEMENCLTEVLALEGWDRQTLEMPPLLKKRILADAAPACGTDKDA